jgi:type IV secretion system protein VirB11
MFCVLSKTLVFEKFVTFVFLTTVKIIMQPVNDNFSDSSWKRDIISIQNDLGEEFLFAFNDQKTCELMLNPDGNLWVERFGSTPEIIAQIAPYNALCAMRAVAHCLGKELTVEHPLLEGEFPLDGSRFAGQIPPIVSSPTFSIRKPASAVFTLAQYVESGIMSEIQKEVICSMVENHQNILVIGGTSSGKTTLTNAIIHQIVAYNPNERIIIIEDTGEIQCTAVNAIKFHTSVEADVTMTHLLKTSLRMRPDRILVGEVRDHAALDLLDAWNTGHEGGVATLHANDAFSGLARVRSLVSRNPYAPKDIDEVIGNVIHCIIHIAKTSEGRRVKDILGVSGHVGGKYITNPFC